MRYIILTLIVGFIVFISIKGCFYPTSYRAFVPKKWDSEYKEFERLCKEETGKVVYAKPIKKGIKLEDLLNLPSTSARRVALSRYIYILIENVATREDEIFYLHIAGFEYYTGWTRKSFSMHDDSKKYITCEPLLYGKTWKENAKIMEQKAFDNKEYIGSEEYLQYSPYHYEHNTLYRQIVNFKQKREN